MKSIISILCLLLTSSFIQASWAMTDKEYMRLAVKSAYKAIPLDENRFKLLSPERDYPANPVIYSGDEIKVKEIICNNTAVFGVKALGNRMGHISLSACSYDSLSRDVINDMEQMFDNELERLTAHKKPNKSKLEEAGLSFKQQTLNNGARLYYFPVFAIGHGVAVIKTIVLHSPDNSYTFVAQHYPEELCTSIEDHELCDKSNGAIVDILLNIMDNY